MPRELSAEIRSIYAYAEDCNRKANLAATDELRQDLLRLQQNWMNLAYSYEIAENALGLRPPGPLF